MMILNLLKHDFLETLLIGVADGIFFGFFMALIVGTLHNIFSKNVKGVYQTTNLQLNLSFDRAYKLCLDSLNEIGKTKILKQDLN